MGGVNNSLMQRAAYFSADFLQRKIKMSFGGSSGVARNVALRPHRATRIKQVNLCEIFKF